MVQLLLILEITIFTVISELSSPLFTVLMKIFNKKSQQEIDIESEIHETKMSMDSISMVNEFAKYARHQRKLIKLKEKLQSKGNEKLLNTINYVVPIILGFFLNMLCLLIVWNNIDTPLLNLEPTWTYPCSFIFGWPRLKSGEVGALCWYFLIKAIVKKLKS